MNKKIKYIVFIAIAILLLLSMFYINEEHEYDLTKVEEIKTDADFINIVYEANIEETEKDKDDVLGTLIIEKINLKAMVKEGSTEEILKEYIGHLTETSKYDGNIGLVAHNRANKYSYFARLNELEIGDKVIYKTKFYTRIYKVTKKKVIYATDWTYLENTKDNRITMITCIADKPEERLCIQAIEVK